MTISYDDDFKKFRATFDNIFVLNFDTVIVTTFVLLPKLQHINVATIARHESLGVEFMNQIRDYNRKHNPKINIIEE